MAFLLHNHTKAHVFIPPFSSIDFNFIGAPLAMAFGFAGAIASRSTIRFLRYIGKGYLAMIRGIPDIVFFLFIPIALDQALSISDIKLSVLKSQKPLDRAMILLCSAAKLPLSSASEWVHDIYGFSLALLAFGFVFGAFTEMFFLVQWQPFQDLSLNWRSIWLFTK